MRLLLALLVFMPAASHQEQLFSLPELANGIEESEAPTETKHSIRYADRGRVREVPKGVYHFVETENVFDGGFKVPDVNEKLDAMSLISEVMQTVSNAGTKRETMSGIYVPMPFGMRPLNLQVAQSGSNGLAFRDEAHPYSSSHGLRRAPQRVAGIESLNLTSSALRSLHVARDVCLQQSPESCDQALDGYFRARFGSSPMAKTIRRAEATSSEPHDIAQTELASWLLPGMRESLDRLREEETLEESTSRRANRVYHDVVLPEEGESRRWRRKRRRPQRAKKRRSRATSMLTAIPRW